MPPSVARSAFTALPRFAPALSLAAMVYTVATLAPNIATADLLPGDIIVGVA